MLYNNEDIRELCLDVDKILVDGNRYNGEVINLEDLQNRLRRKTKFKEIDFQSQCEDGNSLGDLLLKYEDIPPCAKDFLLRNGFNPPQQEQIAEAETRKSKAHPMWKQMKQKAMKMINLLHHITR